MCEARVDWPAGLAAHRKKSRLTPMNDAVVVLLVVTFKTKCVGISLFYYFKSLKLRPFMMVKKSTRNVTGQL